MNNKLKKVLFFTHWYPNSYQKISGLFIQKHAEALSKYYQVAVFFVFSDPNLKSLVKFETVKEADVDVFRYSHLKFRPWYLLPLTAGLFLWCSILGYFKLTKIWGKADFNHVHVLTRCAIVPFFENKFNKIPYFITEHWSRYLPSTNAFNGFLRKLITKQIVKDSKGISAVSENLKKAMQNYKLQHENFRIINNVVDTQEYKPCFSRLDNQTFSFIHVSGLTDYVKNISGILRAVKKLKDAGYNFRIDMIGNDPDRYPLEVYSNSLGLQGFVFFHGELYGNNLVMRYQQADAFVMFSNFENQPCVLLESFCCGLPVIATAVGGIPEIVNSNNGLLVNAKDESALKNAMQLFLQKQVSFNPETIRKEAVKKYSYEAVASQFIRFYNT